MLHPRANAMLAFALPALIIGSASSLVLLLMMKVAATLQQWLWVTLPDALSLTPRPLVAARHADADRRGGRPDRALHAGPCRAGSGDGNR